MILSRYIIKMNGLKLKTAKSIEGRKGSEEEVRKLSFRNDAQKTFSFGQSSMF